MENNTMYEMIISKQLINAKNNRVAIVVLYRKDEDDYRMSLKVYERHTYDTITDYYLVDTLSYVRYYGSGKYALDKYFEVLKELNDEYIDIPTKYWD